MLTDKETIGFRIVKARSAKGLSATALARAIEINPTQLSRYEVGKNLPRPHVVERIAQVTGVAFDWLMKGDGANETPAETAAGKKAVRLLLPSSLVKKLEAQATASGTTLAEEVVRQLEAGPAMQPTGNTTKIEVQIDTQGHPANWDQVDQVVSALAKQGISPALLEVNIFTSTADAASLFKPVTQVRMELGPTARPRLGSPAKDPE
ncbi:helix-turn-helix transcriptional regulator [Comamonadaceae bacterium PP-2]